MKIFVLVFPQEWKSDFINNNLVLVGGIPAYAGMTIK
jgi:hypothetical protein